MKRRKIFGLFIGIVALLLFAGCGVRDKGSSGVTQREEASFTERQQQKLIKAVPPPALEYSLERENLSKRLVRFNDPNKVSYIYLISYGKVMGFYAIKGKVSSVNSRLTTGEQIVSRGSTASFFDRYVVESPQLDGSYGTNGNAIFFFTTEGVYVEWSGVYMLSDRPLKMSTPPALVYTKKIK